MLISHQSISFSQFIIIGISFFNDCQSITLRFLDIFLAKRAFVFLLISTLFLTPVRRWINYSEQKSDNVDFKVLSFNNKVNEYGIKEVENYVSNFNADFCFLTRGGLF
jgi:hypothetical protein